MGMTRVLAVYSARPVMVVLETEGGTTLELCLDELAEVYDYLRPTRLSDAREATEAAAEVGGNGRMGRA